MLTGQGHAEGGRGRRKKRRQQRKKRKMQAAAKRIGTKRGQRGKEARCFMATRIASQSRSEKNRRKQLSYVLLVIIDK